MNVMSSSSMRSQSGARDSRVLTVGTIVRLLPNMDLNVSIQCTEAGKSGKAKRTNMSSFFFLVRYSVPVVVVWDLSLKTTAGGAAK